MMQDGQANNKKKFKSKGHMGCYKGRSLNGFERYSSQANLLR